MSDLDARSFVNRQGKLVVADELLNGLREGREVLVSIRRLRNPKHHRLLFARLRKVRDNSEQWDSDQALLDDLKLATDLFETRVNLVTKKAYAVRAPSACCQSNALLEETEERLRRGDGRLGQHRECKGTIQSRGLPENVTRTFKGKVKVCKASRVSR